MACSLRAWISRSCSNLCRSNETSNSAFSANKLVPNLAIQPTGQETASNREQVYVGGFANRMLWNSPTDKLCDQT